ncbi:Uncharacterized protein SAMN05421770_10652 [Granulicella rosea]|uniref:Photosynthesis system II assembly factor Ycf48/Hcf136-like domain-containing protein n=1 Tax=Granulicella rosea TaxID=474952 RepID=A0A239L4P0_9BACT|nr:hypothetical protein [Granulicella rosea]SNT24514.1 Uncharacterized protein SAMN05421770_10652 [Granulicella rosea]
MRLLPLFLLAATAAAHAQFELQESHTTASLRGIHAVSAEVAWASGTGGTVLRTEDGGKNWKLCAVPEGAEKLDFRGVQAFDATTAIVMSSGTGDLSRIYKTVDGCSTWTLAFTNPDKDGFFDAVRFRPGEFSVRGRGVLLGDPVNGEFALFLTTDGGDTWIRRLVAKHDSSHDCSVKKFAASAGEAVFAASNEALAYEDTGSFYFVTGGARSRLAYVGQFRELDGLWCSDVSKFIKLPLGGAPSAGAFATAVKTRQGQVLRQMMVVGGDYRQPEVSAATAVFVSLPPTGSPYPPSMYFSARSSKHPPHGYRSSVAYDDRTKTWITVGPNGTDLSRDDGKNWRPSKPGLQDQPDADKNWNALSLPFVVGPKGRIGRLRPGALVASPKK